MTKSRYVECFVVFALAFLLGQAIGKAQQPRGEWLVEECWTNACVKNKLDSLSFERSSEAKLTTWRDRTYVWYRQ